MLNAFGVKVFSIKEILSDKKVESSIRTTLYSVLSHLGISFSRIPAIVDECLLFAKNSSIVEEYELKANSFLEKEGLISIIPEKFSRRAELIYSQIKPFLKKGSVLDFGCGDGKVGELLSKDSFDVLLADVYRHSHINETTLKFVLFNQDAKVPIKDSSFDNILALTVFHHCNSPLHSFSECVRLAKNRGRIIVIESVFGVFGAELSKTEKEKLSSYIFLLEEEQRKVNSFFDHFYNRVIHYSKDPKNKVNVPFNFNTPDGWKKLFESHGVVEEKVIHLGIDQPSVPEYHTIHVLRVEK
ncbi:MAG: methyltransferase domain-containing protein [Candidatus Diapherotrites archaeon]|nr:methyltransferase domain-containing protein [Candidatus Diapherotrites archaeon]